MAGLRQVKHLLDKFRGYLQQPGTKIENHPDFVLPYPQLSLCIRNRRISFRRGRADNLGGSCPPLVNRRRGLGADLEKY